MPTEDLAFLASVELESLALLEAERHEGVLRVALLPTACAREVGNAAVAAGVAVSLDKAYRPRVTLRRFPHTADLERRAAPAPGTG
jgi:hypothetical protein